jgi:hypothetical protein
MDLDYKKNINQQPISSGRDRHGGSFGKVNSFYIGPLLACCRQVKFEILNLEFNEDSLD